MGGIFSSKRVYGWWDIREVVVIRKFWLGMKKDGVCEVEKGLIRCR